MTPIFYNWLRRIRRQGTIKPRSAFQYMQEESATMQSVPDKNTATILNSIQQHHFKKTAKWHTRFQKWHQRIMICKNFLFRLHFMQRYQSTPDSKPITRCHAFPLEIAALGRSVEHSRAQLLPEPFPLQWLLTCGHACHVPGRCCLPLERSSPEPSVSACRRRWHGVSNAPAPPGGCTDAHALPSDCHSSEAAAEQSSTPRSGAQSVHVVIPTLNGMLGLLPLGWPIHPQDPSPLYSSVNSIADAIISNTHGTEWVQLTFNNLNLWQYSPKLLVSHETIWCIWKWSALSMYI